jgi:hypothetical protein
MRRLDEMSELNEMRAQLVKALRGGQAHAGFDAAVKNFPVADRGKKPHGLPYSAWQLVEHLRIAQRGILEFSTDTDGSYKELPWPDAYWPKEAEPPSEASWQQSIDAIHADLKALIELVSDEQKSLTEPFSWGDGQNLLREVLLVIDHAAYHLGELIVLRRLLGNWKSS